MNGENLLVWNVRGLGARARRNVVYQVVSLEKVSLLCLQETKLSCILVNLINDMLGAGFDYFFLPANGAAGGILVAWRTSEWSLSQFRTDSLAFASMVNGPELQPFWLTTVYGPQPDEDKVAFLNELRAVREACQGPWFVCGDFNMIYRAEDKSNGRLNRRAMRRFARFLNEQLLSELFLQGRLFTWSSEREHPTLERIDRAFATTDWLDGYPDHRLRALSTDCSDHAPLLLQATTTTWATKRFRFETIWTRFDGFMQVVSEAWVCPLQNADAFRVLDHRLRNTAKALKSWSTKNILPPVL